jgi:antibiotic biosynthesis monooxygenase (ABM) superfamily enzyme
VIKTGIANRDTVWKSTLRLIWAFFVLIASTTFGIELYRKMNIRVLVSIFTSVVLMIALLIPYLQEIYQSIKNF